MGNTESLGSPAEAEERVGMTSDPCGQSDFSFPWRSGILWNADRESSEGWIEPFHGHQSVLVLLRPCRNSGRTGGLWWLLSSPEFPRNLGELGKSHSSSSRVGFRANLRDLVFLVFQAGILQETSGIQDDGKPLGFYSQHLFPEGFWLLAHGFGR